MLTWREQDTELRTLNYVWLLLQTKRKEFILKWNLFNEIYWGGGHLYHRTHVDIREQFIFYYKYFESPSIYCNSKWLVYHYIVGWIMSPKRYAEVTGHGIYKWTLFGNIWAFENVLSWYHSGLGWSQIKDWCPFKAMWRPLYTGESDMQRLNAEWCVFMGCSEARKPRKHTVPYLLRKHDPSYTLVLNFEFYYLKRIINFHYFKPPSL